MASYINYGLCKAIFEGKFIEGKNNLPYDVKKVIMRDGKVVVVLRNGSKGVSNCSYNDEYDPYVGFCIAYYKILAESPRL